MALNNFIASIWSARILAQLQKSLVFAQPAVVNKDYEGEIRQAGDRVFVHSLGDVSVSPYSRYTNITYEQLTDTRQTLLIDQQQYFAFAVDDIDNAQSQPKVMDAAAGDAAYSLADVADQWLASHISDAGDTVDDGAGAALELTSENIYSTLIKCGVMLDENNVPSEGRFAVLPPWAAALLLENDPTLSADPQAAINGAVGRIAGFNVIKSNNVPVDDGVYSAWVGSPIATSYAEQIVSVEALRLQDYFGDALRGLHVYGAEVLRPDALLELQITPATT